MKKIIFLALVSLLAYGGEVEINAKKFEGDQRSGVSKFTGDVVVLKGQDKITADMMYIYTGKDGKIQKFEAVGNAVFMMLDKGKNYHGKADTIIYQPNSLEYTLTGNAFVEYVEEKRKVYGDKIYMNDTTKQANVEGTKKPAKFIFYTDDNNKTKQ
jgi:lipopolysaccharide export system protein LptA